MIQLKRDEFGNAELVGVDMTALLGGTTEEMNICTQALNMLADYMDIGTVEQFKKLIQETPGYKMLQCLSGGTVSYISEGW